MTRNREEKLAIAPTNGDPVETTLYDLLNWFADNSDAARVLADFDDTFEWLAEASNREAMTKWLFHRKVALQLLRDLGVDLETLDDWKGNRWRRW
jgi:hypothetical protein